MQYSTFLTSSSLTVRQLFAAGQAQDSQVVGSNNHELKEA